MDVRSLTTIKTQYNFSPSNILDIGANDGWFANLCNTVWPTSNLTLIEANPFWSNTLRDKNYKHIITLLGNETKESVIFISINKIKDLQAVLFTKKCPVFLMKITVKQYHYL